MLEKGINYLLKVINGECCRPWSKRDLFPGAGTRLAEGVKGIHQAPPCNDFPDIQDHVSPLGP